MALPAGFVLEDEPVGLDPSVALPPGFQLEPETPPSRMAPSFAGNVGRSAASLADVTIGSVLPAAAQLLAYPLARMGRTPTEAQAATQRIVGAVDQPFGKAFRVTGTPEYQQEAGRQLMDFIGQNFQKGAKWIAEKTGLPTSDVESYLGTLGVAAPVAARPAARAIREAAAPIVEQAAIAAKMPFEQQLQARRERMSLEDYARGPQIDAAAEAKRLGIALNPQDVQPTLGTRALSTVAGERGMEAIANANKNQIRKVVLGELDLPLTTQLDSKAAFDQARMKVAEPYSQVSKLPTMTADDATRAALNRLRPDETLIGSDRYAKAINGIIDDANKKVDAGLDGADLLKNVQTLRQRARKVYNNKNADLAALDLADTNLAVANVLESMIESNIFNPKLLDQFRTARQKMARTYAYEGATDLNTGMVDVNKLSRITAKDNTLTGDIASLGQIAGNFPDAFTSKAATAATKAARIGRTGAAGSLGGIAGYALGGDYASAALGSLFGAGAGELGQAAAARRIASPNYQAGLNLRDMRIPVSQLAAPMQPIPNSQALVPYQAPVEVLMPGEGPYQPNFVMQPNQYGPRVTTPGFAPGPAQLPAPSAQGTMGTLRAEDIRRGQMSRTLGQQAEAQQAAAEAAARRPTSGAVELQINPLTGVPEIARGLRGATPETFSNFGSSLQTAADKVTAGKRFDLTATEKVAWDRTRVDLSEVAPGFKALSDKAVAEKMLDRVWVAETAAKAREKADAFARMAERARDTQARNAAQANRERMLDLAEQMEETLRAPRPDVSSKQQGPKTRAAFREGLFSSPPTAPMQGPSPGLFTRR